jgi:hypothetical protein
LIKFKTRCARASLPAAQATFMVKSSTIVWENSEKTLHLVAELAHVPVPSYPNTNLKIKKVHVFRIKINLIFVLQYMHDLDKVRNIVL